MRASRSAHLPLGRDARGGEATGYHRAVRQRALLLALALAALGCPENRPPADDAGASDASSAIDAGDALERDAAPPPDPIPARAPFIDYVDPTVGTGGIHFNDIGSVHPGPQMPFGMIRPGPDTVDARGVATGFTHCSGYHADDAYVSGVSHVRLHGIGINDGSVVAFMPTLGFREATASPAGIRSRFDQARERASVGGYSIVLDDERFSGREIQLDVTAARRAAVSRVIFPERGDGDPVDAAIVIDLGHAQTGVAITDGAVTILPDARELEGHVRFAGGYSSRFGGMEVHFVMRFSRAFAEWGTWAPNEEGEGGTLDPTATRLEGTRGGAYVRFDVSSEREVRVGVGISLLDGARARMNLDEEASDLDLVRLRGGLEAAWEALLSRVEVEARSERELRIFYTALYHAYFMPTLATDADGHYRGLDGEEHEADGFTYYTDFSLWDTYRTLHPLVALLDPAIQRDFSRSLVAMGEARGTFPRWPLGTGETGGMLGDPAVIVLADSWLRGVRDFDLAAAYRVALESADHDASGGRGAMRGYLERGYVPIEESGGSVSRTLEYAYADHAVAVLAEALGEEADAARFRARAGNYRNVYDPAQGLFVGRHEGGAFEPVREDRWDDVYAEGNARQYLWLAPHDPDGLAALLGGRERALERLGAFFEASYAERRTPAPPSFYWQGNEPDLHAPYLFARWGEPREGARAIAWARGVHYGLGPKGLPGNDDSGTMSAWYVFSALGFFPIAATPEFVLGTPLFTHARIHLAGGRTLVVEAPDASDWVIDPRVVRFDGEALGSTIEHERLAGGGTLSFELGSVAP